MKKLFTLFGLGACLLAASCSNEISSDERIQNFDTKGLTSFSTNERCNKTRTPFIDCRRI